VADDGSSAVRSRDLSLDDAHDDGSALPMGTCVDRGAVTRGMRGGKRCALSKGGLILAVSLAVLGLGGGQASEVAAAASAKCVVEGAGDYGTCAGLNAECCKLWLLECDQRCEGAADQQKLAFECGGLKLKYQCGCSGDACPESYCAASECPSQAGDGTGTVDEKVDCSLPTCTAQPYEVSCPKGQYPRFAPSFPACPIGSARSECRHFEFCDAKEDMEVGYTPRKHYRRSPDRNAARRVVSGGLVGSVMAAVMSVLVMAAPLLLD